MNHDIKKKGKWCFSSENIMQGKKMAITKFESCYNRIKKQLEEIKNRNEYQNDSVAFIHWYLSQYYKFSEQDISEAIIDGSDDVGIDAILLDESNNSLTVMQFKFPSKENNINLEIDQASVLKAWNGFQTLISNDITYEGTNSRFEEFKNQIKDAFISHFRICFISYNKGVIANRKTIDNYSESFRKDTGSEIEIIYHDKSAIYNIFEKQNRNNNVVIKLKYKQMQSAYNVITRNIDSHVGFVNGIDLVKAIEEKISTIFDENIRLYEFTSNVNNGINRTATSTDQSDMFYFYNNGVVFICDQATNSPPSSVIELQGASVVNGCQTLNVLYNAYKKDRLNPQVCLLVRIIVINDYDERMRITEYLNSQTPIRDSYFIANHPSIRELQKQLLENGYFLERQVNEYKFRISCGEKIEENKILQLERIMQYYVGYWDNKSSSIAKRGKNALFDKNKIEELLRDISAEKVIEAVNVYDKISAVLTMYRKMRRNKSKNEFAVYMKIPENIMYNHLDEFRYLNTGDIILLNAFKNLKYKYKELNIEIDEERVICESIMLVREVMLDQEDVNISLSTKNASVFSKVQSKINGLKEKFSYKLD